MKVVKKTKKERTVTLRIDDEVMKKVDSIAKKHEISRQKLVEAILKQVTLDKSFVLNLE